MTKAHPRKSWHWIAAASASGWILWQFSHVQSALQFYDVTIARYLNSFVGQNLLFDTYLSMLNSSFGDKIVVSGVSLIFVMHVSAARDPDQLYQRGAFWTWVGCLFLLTYQCQRLIEEIVARPSPSYVLHDWNNLKKLYGFDVKVGNRDSFPSGHAAAYFFFGFMAFWHYRGMCYLLLSMAVVLPIGRVMTGAHWPSDIYLGSVPLALLLSALAHETRLYRVFGLIELLYGKIGQKYYPKSFSWRLRFRRRLR